MNNAVGKKYDADLASNMQAFDQLPRYVREALANADHNYAARQILRDFRNGNLPRRFAVDMIRMNDRTNHQEFAKQGLIPGGQR